MNCKQFCLRFVYVTNLRSRLKLRYFLASHNLIVIKYLSVFYLRAFFVSETTTFVSCKRPCKTVENCIFRKYNVLRFSPFCAIVGKCKWSSRGQKMRLLKKQCISSLQRQKKRKGAKEKTLLLCNKQFLYATAIWHLLFWTLRNLIKVCQSEENTCSSG